MEEIAHQTQSFVVFYGLVKTYDWDVLVFANPSKFGCNVGKMQRFFFQIVYIISVEIEDRFKQLEN